ncbi:hypothetical protein [Streptomyces sp. NPDC088350]|uniref:hypothetical protein n=1 Tax=Streptomyces sp. NPDC088350 TaxID=3365854 RepID=UPI0038019484
MSGLGELDRPGRPGGAGAWDARSEEWLGGREELEAEGEAETEAVPGGEGARVVLGARVLGEGGPAALRQVADDVRDMADRDEPGPVAGQVADAAPPVADAAPPVADQATCDACVPAALAPLPTPHATHPHRAPHPEGDARPATPRTPPGQTPRTTDRKPAPTRRGAADPVKALMHRHRELCERAVDPLEIAAGLEAHGVTDRTAARFRHRDVFALAEEMYARVPRDDAATPPPDAVAAQPARAGWAVLALLPGVLCAATVTGLRLTDGRLRLTVAAVGVLAVALGVRAILGRGPLSTLPGTHAWRTPPGTRLWTYWLLAYALLGDGLLRAADAGGPDGLPTGTTGGPWSLATAPVLALALACAPAAWCAHHFAVRARRKLATSRALEDFAGSVQPLLLGTFALFLCALTALLALCGAVLGEPAAYAQAVTLGALLLLARLLTVHGFTHAPALALGAAATTEATALSLDFIGRLPGCGFLAVSVDTLMDSWGPGSVPALACGVAALTLLFHTTRTLTRASAHAPADEPR